MGLFKTIGLIDDFVDTGKAAKTVSNLVGGKDDRGDDVNLTKVRRISAAVIEIVGPYLAKKDAAERIKFLGDKRALDRVVEDYYDRLTNQADRDKYEKVFGGEVWGAICERLGVGKLPQNNQQDGKGKQQGGKQPQGQQPAQNPLRDIPEMDLFLAARICLGKKALAADRKARPSSRGPVLPTPEGDAIISKGIERLRQSTLGEKVEVKITKGFGFAAEFLETINNENDAIDAEEARK